MTLNTTRSKVKVPHTSSTRGNSSPTLPVSLFHSMITQFPDKKLRFFLFPNMHNGEFEILLKKKF